MYLLRTDRGIKNKIKREAKVKDDAGKCETDLPEGYNVIDG